MTQILIRTILFITTPIWIPPFFVFLLIKTWQKHQEVKQLNKKKEILKTSIL